MLHVPSTDVVPLLEMADLRLDEFRATFTFVVAIGRGRRAAVWVWRGRGGKNVTVGCRLSGIAEARRIAAELAHKHDLLLMDQQEIIELREARLRRARGHA
jgi:hypothetical protein